MENVVTITNTKENVLDFQVTIQGVDTREIKVCFVIETSEMNLSFISQQLSGPDKWSVIIPPLPQLKRTAYNFHIEVIVDGYFFEGMRGMVNVVGPTDLYISLPKQTTLGVSPPSLAHSPQPASPTIGVSEETKPSVDLAAKIIKEAQERSTIPAGKKNRRVHKSAPVVKNTAPTITRKGTVVNPAPTKTAPIRAAQLKAPVASKPKTESKVEKKVANTIVEKVNPPAPVVKKAKDTSPTVKRKSPTVVAPVTPEAPAPKVVSNKKQDIVKAILENVKSVVPTTKSKDESKSSPLFKKVDKKENKEKKIVVEAKKKESSKQDVAVNVILENIDSGKKKKETKTQAPNTFTKGKVVRS